MLLVAFSQPARSGREFFAGWRLGERQQAVYIQAGELHNYVGLAWRISAATAHSREPEDSKLGVRGNWAATLLTISTRLPATDPSRLVTGAQRFAFTVTRPRLGLSVGPIYRIRVALHFPAYRISNDPHNFIVAGA